MSRRVLHLAPNLALPLDAVTRTFGIFGQRGTGKSTTGAVLVEQAVRAGGRAAVLDPTGVWYGLTREGSEPGLPGVVLGGEHADAPLEPAAGKVVAEFVIGSEYPLAVLDMKLLRKHQRQKFAMDFLETLYHDNRDPLLVVFDEAAQFAPTHMREGGDVPRLLGAVEDLVKLGRSRGLGAVMIEQRIATLNANVREQIETLVAHRLVGPLDRKALKEWIAAQGEPDREDAALTTISKVEPGEALVWSPSFLKFFGTVQIDNATTYDSRATPEVGKKRKALTKRTPVDLETLRERMAETIEQVEANDPKKLRQRLFEAETKLKSALNHMLTLPTHEQAEEMQREIRRLRAELENRPAETVEVPVMTADQLLDATTLVNQGHELLKQLPFALQPQMDQLSAWVVKLANELAPVAAAIEKVAGNRENYGKKTLRPPVPAQEPIPAAVVQRLKERRREVVASEALGVGGTVTKKPSSEDVDVQNGELPGPAAKILSVLAQFPEGRTRKQIAVAAGYPVKGSTMRSSLGLLRRFGYISPSGTEPVVITGAGVVAAGDVEAVPTSGRAMFEHWIGKLEGPAGRILTLLVDAGPDGMSRAEVAEKSGYPEKGSTIRSSLGRLRTLALISPSGQEPIVADQAFFE